MANSSLSQANQALNDVLSIPSPLQSPSHSSSSSNTFGNRMLNRGADEVPTYAAVGKKMGISEEKAKLLISKLPKVKRFWLRHDVDSCGESHAFSMIMDINSIIMSIRAANLKEDDTADQVHHVSGSAKKRKGSTIDSDYCECVGTNNVPLRTFIKLSGEKCPIAAASPKAKKRRKELVAEHAAYVIKTQQSMDALEERVTNSNADVLALRAQLVAQQARHDCIVAIMQLKHDGDSQLVVDAANKQISKADARVAGADALVAGAQAELAGVQLELAGVQSDLEDARFVYMNSLSLPLFVRVEDKQQELADLESLENEKVKSIQEQEENEKEQDREEEERIGKEEKRREEEMMKKIDRRRQIQEQCSELKEILARKEAAHMELYGAVNQ